jgi:uncharacterized protein (TIGR03546 family)
MFALNQLFKLIKILNSEKGAVALASGFALGMVLGFVPFNALIVVGLFFIFCLFRINGGAMFLSWAVFKIIVFPLDPLFDRFGYWLLTGVPQLRPLWIQLYNTPIVPWTKFNNTIVAGSLVAGLLLFVPAIFLFKKLIEKYRESVVRRITQSKWMQLWKTTSVYKLYSAYENLKGSIL